MSTNRPRCQICNGNMKKNGTTSKGTTRWRCTTHGCGASTTKTRPDLTHTHNFTHFINHITSTQSLTDFAQSLGISRWTLSRRFTTYWYIDVPNQPDPHRIHDQILIDGTYTAAGCLLIAATPTHIISWHWAKHEDTAAYMRLIENIAPPLVVICDGGRGAYSAIKKCWPTTRIQRCLVHAQRVVRRYTTSKPRTVPGKTIYTLALKLTGITTGDQAAQWAQHLHEFNVVHRKFLDEKTINPDTGRQEFTHLGVRKAYNSLEHLYSQGWLFTYLDPPTVQTEPGTIWASTTNALEGGFNAQIKLLARIHRGRSGEHQRRMIDWWLYLKTHMPDDPVQIARQCNWGNDQLAKVPVITRDENKADQETGRPALYDNGIGDEYQNNLGVRKGWLGK